MLRIKELRKSKKITAKELANYVNVAESTMSLYENGKREPDFDTLLKIANYLNTSVDYLLGNSDIPHHGIEDHPNASKSSELSEEVIVYHRDGKTVKKHFTKEQMDLLLTMIDAIPEKPKDI